MVNLFIISCLHIFFKFFRNIFYEMGIAVSGDLWHNEYYIIDIEQFILTKELAILNKTFKKVSLILIICFFAAAVLFFIAGICIGYSKWSEERKRDEAFTAEYEPKLKSYITENAEAFERLSAYEIEHAKPEKNGTVYFYIQPVGELQEERNTVFTVIKEALVRSDADGNNLYVTFISRAGYKDVYVYYQSEWEDTKSGKISDKLVYSSFEDPHYYY